MDARAEPTAGLALSGKKQADDDAAEAAKAWDDARVRLGRGRYTPGYEDFGAFPAAAYQHDGGNAENQPEEEDWGQDDRAQRRDAAAEPPAAADHGRRTWPVWEEVARRADPATPPPPPPPAEAPRPAELAADLGADAAAGGASPPAANRVGPGPVDHRGYPIRRIQ